MPDRPAPPFKRTILFYGTGAILTFLRNWSHFDICKEASGDPEYLYCSLFSIYISYSQSFILNAHQYPYQIRRGRAGTHRFGGLAGGADVPDQVRLADLAPTLLPELERHLWRETKGYEPFERERGRVVRVD